MIMTLDTVKAIILAAGYGTRLQPLTDIQPKPLVPLVGRPLVRHTISRLLQSGINLIGINTHHHAALMQKFAAEQNDCCLHISHEPTILGSAGGIRGFHGFLEDEDFFLALNGDCISNIACQHYLPDFLHNAPLVMMLLHDCQGYNNVCINSSREVIDLRDTLLPADPDARLAYTGIAFMSRAFLDLIPPGSSELVPLLLQLITTRPGSVRAAIVHNSIWRDIGTPASYLQAHREILLQRLPLIPECNMPPKGLFIGEGSLVEKDCTLDGFVSIGKDCRIEPGCSLRDCIVWDNTTIAAGSSLKNSVCTPGCMVNV
jgi:NDP-sugar pyrophosphorylase family protein